MTDNASAPQRDDTDDHDLLTYGEAGVRLFNEIQAQRLAVAAADDLGDTQEAFHARERLIALVEAAERNSRPPINDNNFEAFFGYKGTARRNT
jgi:hypothetical protein